MTSPAKAPIDIPSLLRFLTQDAKLPLATAMSKVKILQAASLTTPDSIASSDLPTLKSIFPAQDATEADDKLAKQVLNAAKRVSKRKAGGDSAAATSPSSRKKRKISPSLPHERTPQELEASLALPEPNYDEDAIRSTVLFTNRAPLFLAFCVVLLKYTMPSQPLSSRLSLAQGVVGQGARQRAVYLGIEHGKTAEDEGWGEGQPLLKIMGGEIRVMKRWGYSVDEEHTKDSEAQHEEGTAEAGKGEPSDNVAGNKSDKRNESDQGKDTAETSQTEQQPALWGLDLEALKKSNGPVLPQASGRGTTTSGLPIHSPESARSYLLKSFRSAGPEGGPSSSKGKKELEDKETNLGLLLGALDLLYQSWSDTLDKDEMNRRAWGWYVHCRPAVADGAAGWGGKNEVKLAQILAVRKPK